MDRSLALVLALGLSVGATMFSERCLTAAEGDRLTAERLDDAELTAVTFLDAERGWAVGDRGAQADRPGPLRLDRRDVLDGDGLVRDRRGVDRDGRDRLGGNTEQQDREDEHGVLPGVVRIVRGGRRG